MTEEQRQVLHSQQMVNNLKGLLAETNYQMLDLRSQFDVALMELQELRAQNAALTEEVTALKPPA